MLTARKRGKHHQKHTKKKLDREGDRKKIRKSKVGANGRSNCALGSLFPVYQGMDPFQMHWEKNCQDRSIWLSIHRRAADALRSFKRKQ